MDANLLAMIPRPFLIAAAVMLIGGVRTAPLAQEIDRTRLLRDLSVLAHDSMQGRATGTEGAAKARTFLTASLSAMGARTVGPGWELPFETGGVSGINLAALVPGSGGSDELIVLSAHYDHEGVRNGEVYNGADDNASGVAVALAVARAVTARPLRRDLLVLLTDAEEQGLVGARAFVEAPPVPSGRIALNVNLDMVSRADDALWAAGAYHYPHLEPTLSRVAEAHPVLRLGHDRPGAGADWTLSSDHAPFHRAGIPFVYFGVEDHPDYHRPTDDVGRVNPEAFERAATAILAAVRALDTDLPTEPEPRR